MPGFENLATPKGLPYAWPADDDQFGQAYNQGLDVLDDYSADQFATDRLNLTGLTYAYRGGTVMVGAALARVAGGTIALTPNAVNYVERTAAGVVSVSTISFSSSKLPMAKVTTDGTSITAIEDWRIFGPTDTPDGSEVVTEHGIGDHSDVQIAALATGHFLRFNGSAWTNVVPRANDIGPGTFKPGAFTFPGALAVIGLLTLSAGAVINGPITLDDTTVITWDVDTNLYRSGLNSLKTDDAFTAVGLLTTQAGLVVAAGGIDVTGASTARTTGTYGWTLNDATTGKGGVRLQNAGVTRGAFAVSGQIEGDASTDIGLFAETGGALRFYTGGSATERLVIASGGAADFQGNAVSMGALTTTGPVIFTGAAATSGDVRLRNAASIAWRNAANNANTATIDAVDGTGMRFFDPTFGALVLTLGTAIGTSASFGANAVSMGALTTSGEVTLNNAGANNTLFNNSGEVANARKWKFRRDGHSAGSVDIQFLNDAETLGSYAMHITRAVGSETVTGIVFPTGGVTMNALTATTAALTRATAGDVLSWTNGGATPKTGYLYSDANIVAIFNTAGAGAGRYGIQITPTSVVLDANAGAQIATFTTSALALTNALNLKDGLTSDLSLRFTNETGLGFYRAAAGVVQWALGGASKLQFDFTNNAVQPATAGGLTLGTPTLKWGNMFTNGVLSLNEEGYVRSSAGFLALQSGTTGIAFWDNTFGAERARMTNAGNWLLGTTTPATGSPRLDVVGGFPQLVISDNITDAAIKDGGATVRHYTNAEEPFGVWHGRSASGANTIQFGGGITGINAATLIEFYTAATTTTLSGTLAADLTGVGTGSLFWARGGMKSVTYESTQATGTAPFTIASTTVATNLNADLLDGSHASAFSLSVHTHPESDIVDGAILARLAAAETITGAWTFDNTLTMAASRLLLTAASAAGGAGLRLPHGAAPTTPTDGDVWITTAGQFNRVSGLTKTVLYSGSFALDDLSDVVITAAAAGEFLRHNGTNWVDATIAWTDVSKTGSSLADLATRSAGDLSSGNLAYARLPTGSGTWDTGTDTIMTLSGGALVLNEAGTVSYDITTRSAKNTDGIILDWQMRAKDSAGNEEPYGNLRVKVIDATQGSEDSEFEFLTLVASVGVVSLRIGAGLQVGAPTGGDKGVGTINVAADIYKNNSAYNNPDYVFELAYRGWAERRPDHYRIRSLPEVEEYTKQWHHLPGTHPWRPMGMFDRGDWAQEKIEESFLHLFGHERRIAELERRLAA